jgi:tetratricopeptide (TPR) repeat protein
MARKLTLRQLVLSILALVHGLGHKAIGARLGIPPWSVAKALARKRKKELDDDLYERLLSAITRWGRAAAAIVTGFLESLESLDRETDLTEEERIAIEKDVLAGARLIRKYLTAAVRRSRSVAPEEDYPHTFELPIARRKAEKQIAELRRLRGPARLAVVRFTRAYQSWSLVERCCDEAVQEASRNLQHAAAWARLALAIAKWVPGPQDWRDRVRGYAFAHWANVLKVRGELKAAEACLERAKRLWLAGSDPAGALDPGRLLDLEGSLRRAQRRFDEALDLFDQAIAVSRFPERARIMKGFTYEVMGDYERAIATLLAVEPLVERRGDSRLRYMQSFNLRSATVTLPATPKLQDWCSRCGISPLRLGMTSS